MKDFNIFPEYREFVKEVLEPMVVFWKVLDDLKFKDIPVIEPLKSREELNFEELLIGEDVDNELINRFELQ